MQKDKGEGPAPGDLKEPPNVDPQLSLGDRPLASAKHRPPKLDRSPAA